MLMTEAFLDMGLPIVIIIGIIIIAIGIICGILIAKSGKKKNKDD